MMRLYSGSSCLFSQRCRVVLFEKGMDFEVVDVDVFEAPVDILKMNPYERMPILQERDLILYESNIINEYIDERFPHPQLMPADPIMRARTRLLMFTFEEDLFAHIPALESEGEGADAARQAVRDRLIRMVSLFEKQKYVLGDAFSMLDVVLAPLLWRLEAYEIKLPASASRLVKYAERIFSRQGFIDALTPAERMMRR